jgi:hypothetical protein
MTILRTFCDFTELPEQTQQLLQTAGSQSLFFGLPWFQTFAKYALDPGDRLRIYELSPGEPDSVARIIVPTIHRAKDSGFGKLRKLSSLSNFYTCLYGPIGNTGLSCESAQLFARSIASDLPRWHAVDLKPLDVQSPAFSVLVDAFREAGFVVQPYFSFGNWYLDVRGRTFEQYLNSLPSVLKNTLRRKLKKVEKLPRVKIEIISDNTGLQAAIASYERVYRASWKQPEPYPRFVPELIRICAESKILRLGLVHVDGEPAAAQLWMVQDGTALIYKLAYDERFADLSVGTILTAKLMQHVIDVDRVQEVDYLSGDDAYKKDWMSNRRERWGILAMNPRTISGALAVVRHVGGRAAKRFLQKLAERPSDATAVPVTRKAS